MHLVTDRSIPFLNLRTPCSFQTRRTPKPSTSIATIVPNQPLSFLHVSNLHLIYHSVLFRLPGGYKTMLFIQVKYHFRSASTTCSRLHITYFVISKHGIEKVPNQVYKYRWGRPTIFLLILFLSLFTFLGSNFTNPRRTCIVMSVLMILRIATDRFSSFTDYCWCAGAHEFLFPFVLFESLKRTMFKHEALWTLRHFDEISRSPSFFITQWRSSTGSIWSIWKTFNTVSVRLLGFRGYSIIFCWNKPSLFSSLFKPKASESSCLHWICVS